MDYITLEDKTRIKFRKACMAIIDNKNAKALNYCVNYAKYGLKCNTVHEIAAQVSYILCNMVYWRGPVAKKTRKQLKEVLEELKNV